METKKFKDLEEAVAVWETLKKVGTDTQNNPEQELIDEIKNRFGDYESFLRNYNPNHQILFSDFEEVVKGDYPIIKSVCRCYGTKLVDGWAFTMLKDMELFANCDEIFSHDRTWELAIIIVKECQYRTLAEMLHFFYCIKSGHYVCTDCKISPMAITLFMRQFNSRCNARLWFEEKEQVKKCYLIIENQPNPKVYARVFRTKENAEKALEERDYRTGERLYSGCHIIERTIE